MKNLLDQVKIVRCLNAQSSGGAVTTTGRLVDTAGFEGVMFIAVGSSLLNKAGVSLRVKTAASTTATFVASSAYRSDTLTSGLFDRKILALDVYRPLDRYCKPLVSGASSGHVRSIVGVLYGARRPGSSACESTHTYKKCIVAATS